MIQSFIRTMSQRRKVCLEGGDVFLFFVCNFVLLTMDLSSSRDLRPMHSPPDRCVWCVSVAGLQQYAARALRLVFLMC